MMLWCRAQIAATRSGQWRAVEVFQDSLIETGLPARQEDQRIASETERRNAVLALAERFESGVGGIVNAVGSASTRCAAPRRTWRARPKKPRSRPRRSPKPLKKHRLTRRLSLPRSSERLDRDRPAGQ
jgi:hypothetical protein